MKKIRKSQKILFYSHLSTLLESGVSLGKALESLAFQQPDESFGLLLKTLTGDLYRGYSLSAAMARHEEVFSVMEVQTVKIGETSGKLGELLENLHRQGMRGMELERKISQALAYPAAVFLLLTAVLAAVSQMIAIHIFPALQQQGLELPGPAALILLTARLWQNPPLLILTAILLIGCLKLGLQRLTKEKMHKILWALPVAGDCFRMKAFEEVCRTMAFLMNCGTGSLAALHLAARSNSSAVVENALLRAGRELRQGRSFTESFRQTGIFPGVMLAFLEAGEKAGEIPRCFTAAADFYRREVNHSTETVTAALEPIMVALMGIVTGAAVLLVLSPIYGMLDSISL